VYIQIAFKIVESTYRKYDNARSKDKNIRMEIIQTHDAAAMHVVLFCIIDGAVSGSLGLNEDVIVGRLEALEFQLAEVTKRGSVSYQTKFESGHRLVLLVFLLNISILC